MKTRNLCLVGIFMFLYAFSIGQDLTQWKKLGDEINTNNFTEYWPVISPDGKTLFFIRKDNNAGDAFYCYSQLDDKGNWSVAKKIETFNSAVLSITPDGTTLLVHGYYKNGTRIQEGLSISKRTKQGWSVPQGIDIQNFDSVCKVNRGIGISGAYLANSGKAIIMSLNESYSDWISKLYVSLQDDNGVWSTPKKVNGKINVDKIVRPTYLSSDDMTMFIRGSIFKRLDDTWANWSDPLDIGPIYGAYPSYIQISSFSNQIFSSFPPTIFDKTNKDRNEDIYVCAVSENLKPDPAVLVVGKVLDITTKKPLEANIAYENIGDGKIIGIANTNPITGEYKIVLPAGKQYGFYAKSDKYYPVSENINLTDLTTIKEINKDLYLAPIKKGSIIRLNNLFFDFAKSNLRAESFAELNRLISFLKENPQIKIEISGHTDNVGTDADNLKLSQERAKAAVDYIVTKGIEASRLTAKGYGKTKPQTTNDTEEGRQINRRVEFTIL